MSYLSPGPAQAPGRRVPRLANRRPPPASLYSEAGGWGPAVSRTHPLRGESAQLTQFARTAAVSRPKSQPARTVAAHVRGVDSDRSPPSGPERSLQGDPAVSSETPQKGSWKTQSLPRPPKKTRTTNPDPLVEVKEADKKREGRDGSGRLERA